MVVILQEVSKAMTRIEQLVREFPLLQQMMEKKEMMWLNDSIARWDDVSFENNLGKQDMIDASERLLRFAPFVQSAFPQTRTSKGIIESPLVQIDNMKHAVEHFYGCSIPGTLLLKCDNALPISGSIKARGGIYEVLKHAEELALAHGKLNLSDDYSMLASDEMRQFFSEYHIAVGSTGNLGLSIGIMSAKLGFSVTVHMSADAKAWKKDLLREKGVEVIEYEQDYSKAVEEGRKQSLLNPKSYFVDDENSLNLFLGYSVAALRLKEQLEKESIVISPERPLFVYLPCGVGGGPGGVAFGLKQVFGDAVHFFFAEPTHSPCMLLGCMTKTHDEYSVQDFGLDNQTIADGLAVGRASGFVGKLLEDVISGVYTISDEHLLQLLALIRDEEQMDLEPSALAGFGVFQFIGSTDFQRYLNERGIQENKMVHLVWATGGSMVPKDIQQADYKKGKALFL